MLPPPPPDSASTIARVSSPAAADDAEDAYPSDTLLAEWLVNIDAAMQGLYAPREEVRQGLAEVVLRVFEVSSILHGKRAFSSADLDTGIGLLSTSFGAGMLAAAAALTAAASARDLYSIPEEAEAVPMDEDADLLLAIKMSQETSGISLEDPPVPTTAETVTARDNAPVPDTANNEVDEVPALDDTAMEISEITAPQPPPPPAPPSAEPAGTTAAAPTTVPIPRNLLAPTFLVALTNDARMQLIAEHWRKSGAVLWLLLEMARLGPAQKQLMLKREVVAELVDTLLGDQCPLSNSVYQAGSRPRAPSSYVSIVPGKDGNLPFAAKNIPDWTRLIELLSVLVCASDSLQLAQSLGEVGHTCILSKTLYNTILRQARYTTAATPMLRFLSYENKAFSDLIGESLCDELALCKETETAHFFEVMESLLSIPDSLCHPRTVHLFGGGTCNLLDVMSAMKEQATKHKLICVFIRSFVELVNRVPLLRTVISSPLSKVESWAPWLLKFCFRFCNRCAAEQAANFPSVSPQKNQVNQAILARNNNGTKNSTETKSVTFQANPTVHAPNGTTTDDAASGASSGVVSTLAQQGPFVRVYGEDPELDGTQTWAQRAQRTSELLHHLLLSLGAQPDALIPTDTFEDDPASISASPSVTNFGTMTTAAVHPQPLPSNNPALMKPIVQDLTGEAGYADAMTDEEFAKYLSSLV
jgi:hypothetical protein